MKDNKNSKQTGFYCSNCGKWNNLSLKDILQIKTENFIMECNRCKIVFTYDDNVFVGSKMVCYGNIPYQIYFTSILEQRLGD